MLALLLLTIYQVKTLTVQSQAVIKEFNERDDLFSIKFIITSSDKIKTISIDLKELKCLQTSTITPIILNADQQSPYIFTMNFETNTVSVTLDKGQVVYSQLDVLFEITDFYYPTFNQILNYDVRVNNQDINTFQLSRGKRFLNSLQISSGSSVTQEYTDLTIQFQSRYNNHLYDVIVIKFDSTYAFDQTISSCEGIDNIGKNLNCWVKNNNIYIQQSEDDFVEKSKDKLIIFILKGFLNPYYVGTFVIEVVIQPIQFLDTTIVSSNNFFNYQVKNQKKSQIILTQQNNYINSLSQIDFTIHTQRFNQYLQLEIYIPNKSSEDLIITSKDTNMLVEVITIINKSNQLLKLTINQPQTNYDIKLVIENYLNSDIPSQEQCFYFLTEIVDLTDDQLQIQYGKGILNFIPNNIKLLSIDTTNNYITKSAKTIVKFGIDIVLQKDSLLLVKLNENLNTSKISTLNQVLNGNTLSLYGVFAQQQSEYTIEFENIINPIMPSKFSYLDLQIIQLNEVYASNQNQIEIEIVHEIITMSNFNLGYLITNSYTNMNLDINFNLQHPYFTNVEIIFDVSNINFNQLTKQIECYFDTASYTCQIHQNKLTIFGILFTKSSAHLEIQYFPYPRSLQSLIIQSIRQFNNSITLTQSTQAQSTQPVYQREFNQFQISLQSQTRKLQAVPMNIILIPSQDILNQEYLIFKFDNYLEIEGDAICQINNNLVSLQCEFTDGQIKILITSGSLHHSMSYNILITKIKIMREYLTLQMSAFTQNNYLSQQSSFAFKIKQQSQSSEFLEFTFDPINTDFSSQSNYHLFFENAITIPANGYLQLSSTELSIDFLQGQVIQVSGDEDISNIKIFKQNQKYSLLFYFNKEVQSGMHLLKMQNVSNPVYQQRKEYYTFSLQSYDQNNNPLEFKEYDLYSIFVCPQSKCQICNQQEFCDKCEAPYILFQGQCLKQCPNKTVLIGNQCQRCNAGLSCLECSNIDTVLCSRCSDGYDLIDGFCIWTIISNSTQNQNSTNNTSNHNNNTNSNNSTTNLTNTTIKQQQIYDIQIFAIIVLSFAIVFILRNIFRKQTDFNNAFLAFSGIFDLILQFSLFAIILINYSISQSIISLALCFVAIVQQLYAYQIIKLPLQVDIAYQKCQERSRVAKILKVIILFIDWKTIFIHKSGITNSKIFSVHFQDESKLKRIFSFLFLVKIAVNIANLVMLGIILLSQNQIAQLIYESICYNLAMIIIQLNKFYLIKNSLKNDIPIDIMTDQLNQDNENENQNQFKSTSKVTPEL
uniref:MtA protein n=1 Tax=Paramecium tetraurelia TaxID=5888 RepID=A0A023ZTK4_PARTE|nr:mtA protein [Paramecium tetraurelia]AHY82556.1 mtA protein [Paramecium tetraurelia]